ncbi:MAG: glycosyltransferase family 2 protein [Alphaproteobacteria bacterium]|nr:glycosyltransferase family 2 protein [Alphaproteobacteria bacterium]
MQEPLMSVVVPMYNAREFIRKTLEHLVHQTYKNIEIIIVDDGSTDNSGEIIKQYAKKDKRIKLITQKNAGVSAASNTGILAATGEYVSIHDHDDFVNLDYFEKMADAAIKTGADILCGEVYEPGWSFPKFSAIQIATSLADRIQMTHANAFNCAWRYAYKTEFLRRTGLLFEPAVCGAQDVIFSKSAIILADTAATVPGAVYNVIDRSTSLGKNKKRKAAHYSDETPKAWQRYHELLNKYGANELLAAPDTPERIDTFKMFNRTIFKCEVFPRKKRYYIFGLNIGTKHMD